MEDSLASRLKEARRSASMTQVELSKKSGARQSDISKIERGETLRPAGLIEIATALGVNPGWLATGEGMMIPPSITTANIKFSGIPDEDEPSDVEIIEAGLQGIDAIMAKMAPTLQDSGRDLLRKYLYGEVSADDALNTLASLVDVSYGLLKKSAQK